MTEKRPIGQHVFVWSSATLFFGGSILSLPPEWTVAWWVARPHLWLPLMATTCVAIYFWVRFLTEPSLPVETESEIVAREERVLLKSISLRKRHDLLLDALETLVTMNRDGYGDLAGALDCAERAIALAKNPLLTEGDNDV